MVLIEDKITSARGPSRRLQEEAQPTGGSVPLLEPFRGPYAVNDATSA
jgi:hypothetical protein